MDMKKYLKSMTPLFFATVVIILAGIVNSISNGSRGSSLYEMFIGSLMAALIVVAIYIATGIRGKGKKTTDEKTYLDGNTVTYTVRRDEFVRKYVTKSQSSSSHSSHSSHHRGGSSHRGGHRPPPRGGRRR